MNRPVYLRLSILDLNETLIHELWYYYVNPKYGKNAKPCYMDTDSFIVHVKTDDIYKDIAEDVQIRFETSNFELERPLLKRKNKEVTGLMKDKLNEQIMKEFVGLRVKTCSHLKDNNEEDKKSKSACHRQKM